MPEGSSIGPVGQIPYSLAMVICDAIWRDPYTGKRTILGCFSAVHGHRFPLTVPIIAVFVTLTDGNGKIPIRLRLIDADEEHEPLFTAEIEVEFTSPLIVAELDFHMQGVTFPTPGEYRLQLTAREEYLVERRLVVTQLPGEPHDSPRE
jgi:hypothetical protein